MIIPRNRKPEVRFFEKVLKTKTCWIWLATKSRGYGNFWDGKRYRGAHLFSYEFLIGKVPEGLQIDHLCRNKACVNPAHLEPVTARENMLRAKEFKITEFGVKKLSRERCSKGHKYTPENIYREKSNKRRCKKCIRAKNFFYREKKRAEQSIFDE